MKINILELAKEYLITSEYSESGSQVCHKYEFHPEELEKFAQLIIQECADVARQHCLLKADRSYMIHTAIKQHFGVEE